MFWTINLLTVSTIIGFLGEFFWLFDLASHFRLQFASLGLLLLLSTFIKLKTSLVLYSLLVIILNALPLWSTIENRNNVHVINKAPHSVIVSFNLDRKNKNYDSVITYLSEINADIIFLTEITQEWRPRLRKLQESFPYHFEVPEWVPSKGQISNLWLRKGDPAMSVALFSKLPWTFIEGISLGVNERALAIRSQFHRNGNWFNLIAVQLLMPLPAFEAELQEIELNGLTRFSNELTGPLLVIGDFNLTPYSARFKKLIEDTGLQRSFGGINSTFPALFGFFGLPLDHTLFKGDIKLNVNTGPYLGSDHRPIISTLIHSPAANQNTGFHYKFVKKPTKY